MHVYMCTFMCVQVYVWAHRYMCTYVWKAEENLQCPTVGAVYIDLFESRSLSLAWSSRSKLDWLLSRLQESLLSLLPPALPLPVHATPDLHSCQVSRLVRQALYRGTVPQLLASFFMIFSLGKELLKRLFLSFLLRTKWLKLCRFLSRFSSLFHGLYRCF